MGDGEEKKKNKQPNNMKTPLKSIEEELADCRAEIAKYPTIEHFYCLHHEVYSEYLTESVENRLQYILDNKPQHEQALRFRNLRPVLTRNPTLNKARAAYSKARADCDKAAADSNSMKIDFVKFEAEFDKAEDARYRAWDAFCDYLVTFQSLNSIHTDWPDNTWNGMSIFV